MTQLFDTNALERTDSRAETTSAGTTPGRHLRSVTNVTNPTFFDGDDGPLADRVASWRLDDDTIAIGKAGIAKARAALEEAARNRARTDRTSRTSRKAA